MSKAVSAFWPSDILRIPGGDWDSVPQALSRPKPGKWDGAAAWAVFDRQCLQVLAWLHLLDLLAVEARIDWDCPLA